jgi:hypothetical protein
MSCDPEIVLLAAPALTRLAKVVPEQGLGILDTGQGLDTLARVIVAQQQAATEAEVRGSTLVLGRVKMFFLLEIQVRTGTL